MYNKLSFLKVQDSEYRLFLQLKGFMTNTYWDYASEFLGLETFRLPEVNVEWADLKRLTVPAYLRLGNRLERFFSFIIQESKTYEMIAENVQIVAHKVTLGELDFILRNLQTQEIIHVELGGKLYLYDPEIEGELERWIGPNRSDALLTKLDRLQAFQFPLLKHPQTKQQLATWQLRSETIQQQICFKVRLFLPEFLYGQIPPYVKAEHIRGYYLNMAAFESSRFESFQYFVPEKQDWIVEPRYGEIWFTHKQILPYVEKSLSTMQSPMVWVKKSEQEFETIFVVFW
jgi:hypothetical protein